MLDTSHVKEFAAIFIDSVVWPWRTIGGPGFSLGHSFLKSVPASLGFLAVESVSFAEGIDLADQSARQVAGEVEAALFRESPPDFAAARRAYAAARVTQVRPVGF
jgi:hypothetical protein